MRNTKRAIALLAITAMIFSLFSVNVFADASSQQMKVYFEQEAVAVKAGESFVVNVYVTDQDGNDITTMMPGVGISYGEDIESITVNDEAIVAGKTFASSEVSVKSDQKEIICGTLTSITSGKDTPIVSLNVKLSNTASGTTSFTIIEGAKTGAMDTGMADYTTVVGNPMEITVLEAATITSVDNITVTDKTYGTSAEEVLPETVNVTTQKSSGETGTYPCPVIWNTENYSPIAKGEQTITGTLNPEDPVTLGDVTTVTATVTLQPIALTENIVIADVPIAQEEKTYTVEELNAEFPATITVGEGDLADTFDVTWTAAGELDASTLENNVSAEGVLSESSANGFYSANGMKATGRAVVVPAVNEVVSANVTGVASDGMTLTIRVNRPEENAEEAGEVTVFVNGEAATFRQGTSREDVTSASFENGETDMVLYLPVEGNVGDPFVVDVKYNGASLANLSGTATSADSTIVKTSTGGGGSTGPATNKYSISIADTENGTVTASSSTAASGATVTLTVTPDAGYKLDTLTVTASNGSTVTVTNNQFTMPNRAVTVTATFVEDDAQPTATPAPSSSDFEDVNESDWFYDSVMTLKELGIINGVSDTEFAPNNNVTRAEFTKMVVNLFGVEATGTTSAFLDCTANDWYTPFVIAATEAGYVTGESAEWFGANANITREDICTILGRALNLPNVDTQLTFADADQVADYALQYVKNLVDAGIINGYEDNTFRAKNMATRAEAAQMIKGAYDLLNVEEEAEATAEPTATADPEATEDPDSTEAPEATEEPEATATAEPEE